MYENGQQSCIICCFFFLLFLVPGPKIRSRLQGCEVAEGEDALFSIELSASMVGTWFLNSAQLQHGGRYSIKQSQKQHSLVIHETHAAEDAAEVTFIANGVRDSAVLIVKRRCKNQSILLNLACYKVLMLSLFDLLAHVFTAAVVKFSPLPELDTRKKVETGDAIVLYCEVSHPFAKVSWFKDGEELQVTDGLNIQSDGNMRRIVIQSAEQLHSGVYTCETLGDVIEFSVDVAGKTFSEKLINFWSLHVLKNPVVYSYM